MKYGWKEMNEELEVIIIDEVAFYNEDGKRHIFVISDIASSDDE